MENYKTNPGIRKGIILSRRECGRGSRTMSGKWEKAAVPENDGSFPSQMCIAQAARELGKSMIITVNPRQSLLGPCRVNSRNEINKSQRMSFRHNLLQNYRWLERRQAELLYSTNRSLEMSCCEAASLRAFHRTYGKNLDAA